MFHRKGQNSREWGVGKKRGEREREERGGVCECEHVSVCACVRAFVRGCVCIVCELIICDW